MPRPAPSVLPSTTSCCASKKNSTTPHATPAAARSRVSRASLQRKHVTGGYGGKTMAAGSVFNSGSVHHRPGQQQQAQQPARQAPGITGVSWPPVVQRYPGPTPLVARQVVPVRLVVPVRSVHPAGPARVLKAQVPRAPTSSRPSSAGRGLRQRHRRRRLAPKPLATARRHRYQGGQGEQAGRHFHEGCGQGHGKTTARGEG